MASANPQRTATLPLLPVDALNVDYGFRAWVVDTPNVETGQALPGLLAIDGLIIVPNPGENRLDAYTIAKPSDQKHLSLKWSAVFDVPLTYGATPIYHGLHLFYVVSGGIQRKPVFGGEAQSVDINGVDVAQIEPISGCAPMIGDPAGSPTMITGLKQGVLLFDLINHDGICIEHKFFSENNVMSPVLCCAHVIFTAQQGHIFSLNIGTKPYKERLRSFKHISFSAPVSLGNEVYFEALSDSGERSLARYEPMKDKLSKIANLDSEPLHNLDARRSLFVYPPLTDGKSLFLSDRFGQKVYTYHRDSNFLSEYSLPKDKSQLQFVPHLSIAVDNQIYSANSYGVTILSLEPNYPPLYQGLAMGWPDTPVPVARPIRYGDKLFILCEDRLICLAY